MSSEQIIRQLIDFVKKNGRLPIVDEPGFKGVIQDAIAEFGSLENAFTLAGLVSKDTQSFSRPRFARKRRIIKSPTIKPKNKFASFPNEYFLNLLNLNRPKSFYPAPEGTPKWWERKAGKKYSCSSCSKPIEKTERYIGRKTLSPGQRGIYGYRGTYYTHYFHIICLLKEAANKLKKEIASLDAKIGHLERILVDLNREISEKTTEIKTIQEEIAKKEEDFQTSSRWGKVSKLLGYKYSVYVLNQRILRLEQRNTNIRNVEIPANRKSAKDTSSAKDQTLRYLKTIELDMKKIES